MNEQNFDVVINGGGPVGMALAIDLAQRGHRIAVVERYAKPQPVPKGQNLTQRTMEHFDFWGCEQELRAARLVPRDYGIGGLNTYGALLSGWHYDFMQREMVRPYYDRDNERLPQYRTEAVLRARAAQLDGITVFYGWSGKALTQGADTAELVITHHKGEQPDQCLRARYVVGCDGSRSMVRDAAGISETRRDHAMKMVLLVFRSRELHELLTVFPDKQLYNVLHPDLKGYWQFFGRVDLGESWFFHAPVPQETTVDNYDFAAHLHRAVGKAFAVEFDYIGFWDLRIAIADQYRAGNAFIAGDAAHSHPPYGGYGINTGFEDARNLAWKLHAALSGWGGDRLLDSYDAERRPVFASTARDFIENFIEDDRAFLERYNPDRNLEEFRAAWNARAKGAPEVNAFEPNYRGSPIVVGGPAGQPSAKGSHVFDARAGHHLPPRMLSDGHSVFARLGRDFTLIALDMEDAEVTRICAAADKAGVPLEVIRDSWAEDRRDWAHRMILVRPDHFVAWAGDNGRDGADALAVAVGA
ncbi:FAD-dependent monooxygenase [Roseinatronobacter sp.]|uniref:FAD-dependent monooxygenase n=1 Tax=Roseinatronobacter sp. TaxID=1945755 RepID=UPI003F6F02B1